MDKKKQQRQTLKRQRIQERRGRIEKERRAHHAYLKLNPEKRERITLEKAMGKIDRIRPSFLMRVRSYIRGYYHVILRFVGCTMGLGHEWGRLPWREGSSKYVCMRCSKVSKSVWEKRGTIEIIKSNLEKQI